ncbi:kelch-like protein 10 [Ictalurus punctatus]|uniref:Kelch-like protein 10 n=1 Tax=Ictalurus punctatus TaxID=7998 RepID=A0A9F7TEI4_ICTPU|nr:kelch-like protein 10 [Ictalurus punctatus]
MELIVEYTYTRRVNITEKNEYKLLIAADYLLKQQAFRFILHNFEEMVRLSEEFLDLTVEQLREIIEKDKLNVKQESEAVLQWIKHAPWKRKAHIGVLLPKVRLGLLTHDYLMNNVSNNILVKDDMTCKPIVTSVLMGIDDLNPSLSLSSDLQRLRLPSAVLLAIGGWCQRIPMNAIEAYDIRAACWVKITCNDESPQAFHRMVYLNGFVYCIGGYNMGNTMQECLRIVRRFDPITRTWAQVSPMHSIWYKVSMCALDGHIYAVGGFHEEHQNTAGRYEPENDRWSMIAPMHERRSNSSATVLNGNVYVCEGSNWIECLLTGEYYSPQMGTNVWTQGPAMNNKHSNFGIEVLHDLLFVVGGENGTTTMDEAECYDEQTSEWHAVENMGISCSALSCCVLSGLPNMAEYAAPRDDPYRVPQRSRSTRGYLTPPANV